MNFFLGENPLFCILLFVTQIGHVLEKITAYQKNQEVIELKAIDAGSLFYTESEAAGEADFYFKHN